MPTPSGVNYLLQFLNVSSNSPIIRLQESKVDVQSYVLMSVLCYHTQLLFHYYYYVLCLLRKHAANIVNFIDYGAEFEKNLCARHEFLLHRGPKCAGRIVILIEEGAKHLKRLTGKITTTSHLARRRS